MLLSAFVPAATTAQPASAAKVTITIESWRNDDIKIWQDTIPAFEKLNPTST
jgi:raffinose/stachyose/melibiose transport system substrate-binding protein